MATAAPRKKQATPTPRRPKAATKAVKGSKRTSATKPLAQPARPAPSETKQTRLIALLRSPHGSTMPQMMQLTGWQPHSVRGTISGTLRKKLGLTVIHELNANGVRIYRIADAK